MSPSDLRDANASLARALGAGKAWIVHADGALIEQLLAACLDDAAVVRPLDGVPVACADLRQLARCAQAEGRVLVVDDSLPGPAGCAANRLGAHLSFAAIDEELCAVGFSREGLRLLPEVARRVESLVADTDTARHAVELLEVAGVRWRKASDGAQVVAAYLRCHPRVCEVRYPGRKGDPSFEIAARTLQNGFGPYVDYRLEGERAWRRDECGAEDAREHIQTLEHALMPL